MRYELLLVNQTVLNVVAIASNQYLRYKALDAATRRSLLASESPGGKPTMEIGDVVTGELDKAYAAYCEW